MAAFDAATKAVTVWSKSRHPWGGRRQGFSLFLPVSAFAEISLFIATQPMDLLTAPGAGGRPPCRSPNKALEFAVENPNRYVMWGVKPCWTSVFHPCFFGFLIPYSTTSRYA